MPPISEKVNCDPNYFKGCKAGTIGSTTATIFWGTYKPSTTQLIYGKSTDYGKTSPEDKNMVLDHVVNLTGLQPGTTYHFRTKSVDSAGNVVPCTIYVYDDHPMSGEHCKNRDGGVACSSGLGCRYWWRGGHLVRYSRVLRCVEINSSFYRPHKLSDLGTLARFRDG